MNQQENFDVFVRFLTERHNVLINNLEALSQSLVMEDREDKVAKNEILLNSSLNLAQAISKKDRPPWLGNILQETTWYKDNNENYKDSNLRLLNLLFNVKNAVRNHKWVINNDLDNYSYNFDEVYERFRKSSRLPELFDALISAVEKMISSGEIDSIKALEELRKLLSLLRQNRSSSYFSTIASWEFLVRFTKNTFWVSLDSIPVIKQIKGGFEKTMDEMDMEMDELHKSMIKEIREKYGEDIESLSYENKSQKLIGKE